MYLNFLDCELYKKFELQTRSKTYLSIIMSLRLKIAFFLTIFIQLQKWASKHLKNN